MDLAFSIKVLRRAEPSTAPNFPMTMLSAVCLSEAAYALVATEINAVANKKGRKLFLFMILIHTRYSISLLEIETCGINREEEIDLGSGSKPTQPISLEADVDPRALNV